MATKPGIFPTFFISGFKCSTFLWKHKGRRNLALSAKTNQFLSEIGITVAREGIPWTFVDNNGEYDFSPIDPLIEAMNGSNIASPPAKRVKTCDGT